MAPPSFELYTGLGYLSYAFCLADDELQDDEADAFVSAMLKAFGNLAIDKKGRKATDAFAACREAHMSVEQAYTQAMTVLDNLPRYELHYHFEKLLDILQDIIEADDFVHDNEQHLLDRFKRETAPWLEDAQLAAN